MEPAPGFLWTMIGHSDSLTMPSYTDSMPLFERTGEWSGTRCFELPHGAMHLTEEEAYVLYRDIIEKTTGVGIDTGAGERSILGMRGAWPGTFSWNGNTPNYFNDTLIVIWKENGRGHVREFHAHTDTGAYNFGYHNSSSLRPNRRYRYKNGWHRGYNALQIDEWGYKVRDDSNKNGYWDDDRNGWLDGGSEDHDRTGSGHNIHLASVNAPLGSAKVHNWSAGCQTIPGHRNWKQFIDVAWESLGTEVDYYLVDTRDISPRVWSECTPDGSHECPWEITSNSFVSQRTTEGIQTSEFDEYNCSTADESGPEVVYLFTTDSQGEIEISVECDEPIDVDVHLLDADDANACLERAHRSLSRDIEPGRYFIVVDSWVDGDGVVRSGDYTLRVDFSD
ncbi:MAG: hypothetical protein CL916_15470 [Deltaproteobacteria bacterium]|nr:hypothetical protein [Deltaproteobacteria bacterium]